MITSNGILYIEPSRKTSQEPVIDEATKKMAAALRRGVPGPGYRGWHECACGARSSNCDYTLPNGEKTNSLSVHYLTYHREDVPEEQLAKVLQLECGEAEPTNEEMLAGMNKEGSRELHHDHERPKMR